MSVEVQLRRFNSMERRPKMLKDFLSENPNLNSCSSTGFKNFPRRTPNGVVTVRNSTFQTVIKKIRNISLLTKSPSVLSLPRSISRKLSSRRSRGIETCNSTVKIKDIMRWKSFRDLQPSSVPSPSPLSSDFYCYQTESFATVSNATTTASCSSGGSSWSEGDFFTASWEAQNDGVEVVNKNKKVSFSPFFVGRDSVAPFVGTKEDLICQEDEQNSPVSVLQVGEDEFSLFDQSLANIERRKQKFKQTVQKLESLAKFDLGSLDQLCLSLDENSYFDEEYEVGDDDDDDEVEDQKCEEQEWIEKRAKKLLHCVKAKTSSLQGCDDFLGDVVLDFFREELTRNRNQNRNDEVFELEILKIAENWIKGSFAYEDIVHVNKDDYINNMDRRGGWSRFKEEEQEELVMEIEADILHNLVVGLLDLDSYLVSLSKYQTQAIYSPSAQGFF